jgi:Ni/Co efflux regulator RcnB
MSKRIQKLVVAVAALAALALGGAVMAQAQSSPAAAPARTSAPDRDNVQSGDQTTPDRPATATKGHRGRRNAVRAGAASERPGAESPEQGGGGSESAPGSDGPGGHADEPGNANADHQFQGNE